jgi:hypothetical protein
MLPDSLMTVLNYSNSTRTDTNYCPVVVSDMPVLKYYLTILKRTKLQTLKDTFKNYLNQLSLGNFYYNFEMIQTEDFDILESRIKYSIEILKQLSHSSKRVVFVANYQHCNSIVKHWKAMEREVKQLDDFFVKEEDFGEIHFIDFIEKIVIVDILNNSFINDNFIQYESFPFRSVNNPSWQVAYANVFQLWKHYYTHYSGLLSNQQVSLDKYKDYINQFNKI